MLPLPETGRRVTWFISFLYFSFTLFFILFFRDQEYNISMKILLII
ncbi:hypothetical protein HMPREF1981_02099 [Bacteroides pyogenes F0041]|uniref:Uncharacterized protein n=1 Tax=Bacteroides pyogenes F0041 TaxID=1321819 RepID=U2DTA6_9BACE|nr:hypothetical protein HMPREF1981_02099 [Bacteroides pyogenes F0041]